MKLQPSKFYLLGVGNDPKTSVDLKNGYMVGILYLAPADLSGKEVCTHRSAGCTEACYNSAGRGAMQSVQDARIRKTNMFHDEKEKFMELLQHDIQLLCKKAKEGGYLPAVRLNGTSDIPWEAHAKHLMEKYSEVAFYDYTKIPVRAKRWAQGKLPSNYHLTFSRSEENWGTCLRLLNVGVNVAAVFQDTIPESYYGYECVVGDKSDLRFLDKPSDSGHGKIIALVSRGKGKKDTSGFVIHDHCHRSNWFKPSEFPNN